jgi:predicted amidohydrolase
VERLRVACCQFRAAPADKRANVERMRGYAREAAGLGCRVVLYPECIVTGYLAPERMAALAEPLSGPSVTSLRRAAAELGVALAFGLAERGEDGRCRNSLVFVGTDGAIAGAYRKVHLWDTEKRWAEAGDRSLLLDYCGARTGGWICYDTRFPELARAQGLAGAELALVATAWLGPGEEWELSLRARALENMMFVAGADIVDPPGCRGRSMVVDPYGNVIARAREDAECLITADLDPEAMNRQRGRLPLFRDRRPDAYAPPDG